MMLAPVAIVVAVVGLLMYILAGNPKVQEIGRILLFCGALVATMAAGQNMVKVF